MIQQFLELIGLDGVTTILRNRLIYSLFSLLIFVILIYFWSLANKKSGAKEHNSGGLVFLSFTFLLYFAIGIASVYNAPMNAKLVLSGLISMCYFLALPFFSLDRDRLDHIIVHDNWRNVVKLLGVAWLVLVSWLGNSDFIMGMDTALNIGAFTLMGFFITRYFAYRRMLPIAFLSFMIFLTIILLQLFPPETMVQSDKFTDMNTMILGPGLVLSVIILAYTFNWINELNFYELSSIWVSDEEQAGEDTAADPGTNRQPVHQQSWMERIARDELEDVIEEVIIMKKHRNESLEMILNIASRNTRNNNNRLKDVIAYEDYQLNRNKVSEALLLLVGS